MESENSETRIPAKNFVRSIPRTRVELHVHLDGAVRHETIWELAQYGLTAIYIVLNTVIHAKKGIVLPGNGTLREMKDKIIVKYPRNLQHFLEPFGIFSPCFVGDMKAIERAAYEFCEDEAQNGVIYVEARYAPHFWLSTEDKRGQLEELSEVVQAVNRGFDRGKQDFGVEAKSILCTLNGTNTARDILELCKKFKGEGVVGMDLAMLSNSDAEPYEEVPLNNEEIAVYHEARKCGIHRTIHAGESGGADMIERAVDIYESDRIGHGYHVFDNLSIYKMCLEKNIHFETCPWSSFLTGAVSMGVKKHPIIRFAEDGANFSLNTDDPTVTGHTLQDEFNLVMSWGLTEAHIVRAVSTWTNVLVASSAIVVRLTVNLTTMAELAVKMLLNKTLAWVET